MDSPLVYLASVLALGIGAEWLAWRLHLPAILLLLAFGFAAGRWVDPEEILGSQVFFPIVSLSVAVIMFEGGLSLRIGELRESGGVVLRLVTIAVGVTWVLAALATWLILDFTPEVAALTGALLVVSGPTVIVPLLRHMRPVRRFGSIAKWEGIVNDPIGAVLAVLVFEAILAGSRVGAGVETILMGMFTTGLIGLVLGWLSAAFLIWLLRRYLIPDYLQNPVFLTVVLLVFVASHMLQPESGLLTVTVLGIVMANQKSVAIKHVIEFKENLRVLLISSLFIVLASRIKMSDLAEVGWRGVALVAVLILVVRPVAVFLSTLGTELSRGERLLLAWLAPRGIVAAAVSSLFALEMAHLAGHAGNAVLSPEIVEQARLLAPVTFLVIVGTVSVYGLTAAPLARRLGLSQQNPQGILFAGAAPWIRSIAETLKGEGYEVLLVDTNYDNISAARMAGLNTCFASIVSEYVQEELELAGIGRLLAVTPNDDINALATLECAELFGRAEVYQLAPPDTGGERRSPAMTKKRGRILFSHETTYGYLSGRFASGGQLKKTPLTEDFKYDDFRRMYGPTALVLFVIRATGGLVVQTADQTTDPQPGDRLISLIDPTTVADENDAEEPASS